mmetsp:Transcript_30275/g.80151  ORF Transcript_30275/g.80151 Transcript_30275/m.80151 type:complete len:149 (-) Transcript_30275:219-665(-)
MCTCIGAALRRCAQVSVGASGAILGIVGCVAGQLMASWAQVDPQVRSLQVGGLVSSGVVLALLGIFAPVDNWSHLGGAATGVILGLYMYRSRLLSDWARGACRAGLVALGGGMVLMLVVLFARGCPDVSCADLKRQLGCGETLGSCYA